MEERERSMDYIDNSVLDTTSYYTCLQAGYLLNYTNILFIQPFQSVIWWMDGRMERERERERF